MHELAQTLVSLGFLDSIAADWARNYCAEEGIPFDSALLELDLIDEDELLRGLESWSGLPSAKRLDLANADPHLADLLPDTWSRSFGMCPLRLEGSDLVCLVNAPLTAESAGDLRDVFGLNVRQLVAPHHLMTLAEQRIYRTPVDDRVIQLERRLMRRLAAADVGRALARVDAATSLSTAVGAVLKFASALVDASGFFLHHAGGLYVLAVRGRGRSPGATIPVPSKGSSVATTMQHGACFVGPILGTPADHAFFQALGRPVPRCAFVAPVPTGNGATPLFYADNGLRGIAPRWIAEMTLLVTRVGRHTGDWEALPFPGGTQQEAEAPASEQLPPGPETIEANVLRRLRDVAKRTDVSLTDLVDGLLGAPTRDEGRQAADTAAVLGGEVRLLFDKLARELPVQLARGMEAAFKDTLVRVSGGAAAASQPSHEPLSPRPEIGLSDASTHVPPRSVANYQDRRRKANRLKL